MTENPGRMHLVRSGEFSAWITGLPEVDAERQGGLLDVCVAADFDATRRVMWNYAEPSEGGTNGTLGATGVLSPDGSAMEGVEVIFRKVPGWASTAHCGSRLVFGADGALFVTPGEGSQPEPRQLPQDVSTHFGKVLRHTSMGRRAAPGDPNIERALPKIWSYGTATSSLWRWDRTGHSGESNTAHAAATSSTASRPAATRAGRCSPTARSTAVVR